MTGNGPKSFLSVSLYTRTLSPGLKTSSVLQRTPYMRARLIRNSTVIVALSFRAFCSAIILSRWLGRSDSTRGSLGRHPNTRNDGTIPSGPNVSLIALRAILSASLGLIVGDTSLIFNNSLLSGSWKRSPQPNASWCSMHDYCTVILTLSHNLVYLT